VRIQTEVHLQWLSMTVRKQHLMHPGCRRTSCIQSPPLHCLLRMGFCIVGMPQPVVATAELHAACGFVVPDPVLHLLQRTTRPRGVVANAKMPEARSGTLWTQLVWLPPQLKLPEIW
jgi:hypothetical protein